MKSSKNDAAKTERPTVRPTFDVVRFAKIAAHATPMPESQPRSAQRPRVPQDTIPAEPLFPQPPSASSLQAAMTRMLDRSPEVSSVEVLGMFDRVPVVRMGSDELRALTLDHRAGFILSLIDGTMTVATILDLGAMSSDEAIQILSALLDGGVIELT